MLQFEYSIRVKDGDTPPTTNVFNPFQVGPGNATWKLYMTGGNVYKEPDARTSTERGMQGATVAGDPVLALWTSRMPWTSTFVRECMHARILRSKGLSDALCSVPCWTAHRAFRSGSDGALCAACCPCCRTSVCCLVTLSAVGRRYVAYHHRDAFSCAALRGRPISGSTAP